MAILRSVLSFADGFARNPSQAAVDAALRPSPALGLAGYFLGALSVSVWAQLLWGESGGLIGMLDVLFILLLCNLFLALLCAGLSNLFLEFSGAKSRSLSLFVIFGLAEGVKAVLVPSAMVLMAFGASGFGPVLFLIVLAAQFLCALGLMARVYQVTKFQAFLALSFPGMLAGLLAFLSFSAFVLWVLTGLKTTMPA